MSPGNGQPEQLDAVMADAFDSPELATTLSVVVMHRGEVVAERYGPTSGPDTALISWSMAKSFTHAVVGCLVADGLVDVAAEAPVPEWANDERRAITLDQLLAMSSGLAFREEYVDDQTSDVIDMLFGDGSGDVAGFAARSAPSSTPGSVFSYSSGTTNIICGIIARTLGSVQAQRDYFAGRLFEPLAMTSADPRFDDAGTFIGSSFLYATARDFARFGELYRLDGRWNGSQLLPEGWTDYARTPAPTDTTAEYMGYGRHWWLWDRWDDLTDVFSANGYEGQTVAVSPRREVVVCRLGKTPERDDGTKPVFDWARRVMRCFEPST